MKNNLSTNKIKVTKQRRVWGFNPVTRVKISTKIYSQKNDNIPSF